MYQFIRTIQKLAVHVERDCINIQTSLVRYVLDNTPDCCVLLELGNQTKVRLRTLDSHIHVRHQIESMQQAALLNISVDLRLNCVHKNSQQINTEIKHLNPKLESRIPIF
jgi:hypothetical protein